MCIFPTFIIDRQRELRYSGHSTAARSAARAAKRCLTPHGGEKMSCANMVGHSVAVGPMPVPLRWPTFETIVAIYEAFQEAMEMRRTAYKEHHLTEE
jgi:hypothetical protein